MKLKNWLLLSYLIVMILPLFAAYLLFAWINAYNDDQKVDEFFDTSIQLQAIQTVLDNPSLFEPGTDKADVENITNKKLSISLYNPDGLVVYTSNPALTPPQVVLGKEALYENLYHLEQGYRSYSYKQPVFDEREIVGFYQIELARDAWVSGVSDRGLFILGIFIAIFILIYVTVIYLVNRKLNKRLTQLMEQMSGFAAGKEMMETPTNHDEIGQLTKRFYEMKKQINESRAVIDQEQQEKEYMIATISHDLKTPLTSIKAYAESLSDDLVLTESEQHEYQQVIIEKSDFMKQMLDDLLTYTILKSPTYEMEFVEVEGDEFFEMLVADYEPLCKQKNIQLYSEADVTGVFKVNPKQMIRVVDNLMSNAIKHTNKDGEIWVTAINNAQSEMNWLYHFANMHFDFEKNVYLIVQNTGYGITTDKLNDVFDPLYQVDQARSKRDDHGTGLGLSITKQIIEKHQGDIHIFSEKALGTCVIVRLPIEEGVGEGHGMDENH